MRILAIVMTAAAVVAAAQAPIDSKTTEQLRRIFPDAASFAPKGGEPPHFKVFKKDPAGGAPVLAGLAFWTTELEPLERG